MLLLACPILFAAADSSHSVRKSARVDHLGNIQPDDEINHATKRSIRQQGDHELPEEAESHLVIETPIEKVVADLPIPELEDIIPQLRKQIKQLKHEASKTGLAPWGTTPQLKDVKSSGDDDHDDKKAKESKESANDKAKQDPKKTKEEKEMRERKTENPLDKLKEREELADVLSKLVKDMEGVMGHSTDIPAELQKVLSDSKKLLRVLKHNKNLKDATPQKA